MEDFSVALLSKLLRTSIKLCSDNDKARHNAVRAVGNLLRYLPEHTLGTCQCQNEVPLTTCLENLENLEWKTPV